jgi:hypothetical protein
LHLGGLGLLQRQRHDAGIEHIELGSEQLRQSSFERRELGQRKLLERRDVEQWKLRERRLFERGDVEQRKLRQHELVGRQ